MTSGFWVDLFRPRGSTGAARARGGQEGGRIQSSICSIPKATYRAFSSAILLSVNEVARANGGRKLARLAHAHFRMGIGEAFRKWQGKVLPLKGESLWRVRGAGGEIMICVIGLESSPCKL